MSFDESAKRFDEYWPFTDVNEPQSEKDKEACCDEINEKALTAMKSEVLLNDKQFLLGFLPC